MGAIQGHRLPRFAEVNRDFRASTSTLRQCAWIFGKSSHPMREFREKTARLVASCFRKGLPVQVRPTTAAAASGPNGFQFRRDLAKRPDRQCRHERVEHMQQRAALALAEAID